MILDTPLPQPGEIVRVRQRLYLVESVAEKLGESPLVTLHCVDDDAQGQELQVLWDREIDPLIIRSEAWDQIARRGFDASHLFAAYINTLKWNCVTSTDPRLFQSPFRAGIKLETYQLEPLRKALRLPRVNLFIADDVGLGKTIEAGLITRELLLRKKAREVIVSCPPSMLLQWQEELEARFGLTFEILDRDYMKRVRRERGFGVNPWSTHSRFLISHNALINEEYTGPLHDWLGDRLTDFRAGTLLILDEAHHAAPASGQRYAIDSKITRAVRDLAGRFEHRLFLSATPHNGHSNSFSALLEILDPQRFCRGVPVTQKMLEDVMVRRLKEDIRHHVKGFPKRNVVQIDITGLPEDAPELQLAAMLDQYRQMREQRLSGETRKRKATASLLLTGLQQRLLSSIEAFWRTLRVHRQTVERHWQLAQANQPIPEPVSTTSTALFATPVTSDEDRAEQTEEDLRKEEELQVEALSAAAAGPMADAEARRLFAQELQLLDRMTALADESRHLPDARVVRLLDWIRKHQCPGLPTNGQPAPSLLPWTDTRVIIFTEADDTRRYLQQRLQNAIAGTDQAEERIAIFHGPSSLEERKAIKLAFNTDPAKHPLRILIATDAAREGLNFQAHCWNLFHFDVPWNPSRMEQRNGRIDRKLQPRDEVFCHYFNYVQRPEDRILACLVRKTETIKKELGSLSRVIDARLEKALQGGIRRNRIDALEQEIGGLHLPGEQRQAVEEELEAARERQEALVEQLNHLRGYVERSRESIGLQEAHFRSAISSALELVGAAPLEVIPGRHPGQADRCTFPALDQRSGADPTWTETMDTLRAPRGRDQKPWEWRRAAPIRPVVFEDPGTLTDEVVHLHLEHRMVQRLLGRFIAQGFVHHDLSRACLTQTRDAIPRVILLGRLCLYGSGAARLHEELIPITARYTEPSARKEDLAPYAREAEAKTLSLLSEALADTRDTILPPDKVRQLQENAPRDIQQLLAHLQKRGEEYAEDAVKKLAERGEAEARAMRDILENQKKFISQTRAKYSQIGQLDLGYQEDELHQLESNKRHWQKRLLELEKELLKEPQRIREIYQVKATRIEPIGLVYLWPVTG